MHDRQFVWTWWAGMVRDSFGPGSMFRVARVGSLRVGRRMASGRRRVAVGSRRPPRAPIGVRLAWDRLLVALTKLPSVVGGLVKKLSGVLDREKEGIE
jgi:hypothetical protein